MFVKNISRMALKTVNASSIEKEAQDVVMVTVKRGMSSTGAGEKVCCHMCKRKTAFKSVHVNGLNGDRRSISWSPLCLQYLSGNPE